MFEVFLFLAGLGTGVWSSYKVRRWLNRRQIARGNSALLELTGKDKES